LQQLVAALPADFPAALLIAMHVPPDRVSHLPEILTRSGVLPAQHAEDGLPIEPAHIYVAPPNRHLLVEDGHLQLSQRPRQNGSRSAIDVLFRSAAETNGTRIIGVVLSGLLNDGTQGLAAIKQAGGITVVQDPHEAEYATMPLSAVEHVAIDYVLPAAQLALKLLELVQRPQVILDNETSSTVE
jgi:two-component system chemotaxis response regulator CheB